MSEILSALSVLCKDIDRPQDKIELLWNVACEDFGLEPDRYVMINHLGQKCVFGGEEIIYTM